MNLMYSLSIQLLVCLEQLSLDPALVENDITLIKVVKARIGK